VSFLVENARRLAEAAQANPSGECLWTFMIGPEGGIEMLQGAAEPIDTILATRGARAVWRVRRERGIVRVEGRMGRERCLIEEPAAAFPAREALLAQSRMYELNS